MKARKNGRGEWVVSYYELSGARRQPVFKTKGAAEDFILEELPKLRRLNSGELANITVGDYFTRWLGLMRATVEDSTLAGYESVVRVHVIPRHGDLKMRDIRWTDVLQALGDLLATHTRHTVRRIHQTYHAAFDAAIKDEIILVNPAQGLDRKLRVFVHRKSASTEIKAMTKEESQAFLATALRRAPDLYPMFVFMLRNGFRPGEAYAAHIANLNLDMATYYVQHSRSAYSGQVKTTKNRGSIATVQLTPQTVAVLREHIKTLPVGTTLLFPSRTGAAHGHRVMSTRMMRILKWANLPLHFTPHCLRHTYASQALAQGENLLFVQQQMRHATVAMTADTYGRWLPKQRMTAANGLDDGPEPNAGICRDSPVLLWQDAETKAS